MPSFDPTLSHSGLDRLTNIEQYLAGLSAIDAGEILYSTNYQAGTINLASTTAEPGISVMSITGWFDGTVCDFEISVPNVTTAASANATVCFNLVEDGTDLGRRAPVFTGTATSIQSTIFRRWTHVPPITGNALTQHTYDIYAWCFNAGGSGSISNGPDNTVSGFGPMEFTIYRATRQ